MKNSTELTKKVMVWIDVQTTETKYAISNKDTMFVTLQVLKHL